MLSSPGKTPRTHLEAVLEATRRASARSAAVVHLDMKKRLDSLATIASIKTIHLEDQKSATCDKLNGFAEAK
jgi:hypothetical protein